MLALDKKRRPDTYTYVDPNPLFGATSGNILGLGLELSGNKRQHILPTTKEDLSRSIVSPGLFLVETFKGTLLGAV